MASEVSSYDRERWANVASGSIVSNRGEYWYNHLFEIADDGLVLDVGSGLSKYAPDNFIRADFSYRNYAPHVGKNVATLFQELPFKDASFEQAIASWSLIKLKRGAVQGVSEVLRVVRPGGNVQVFPGRMKRSHLFHKLHNEGLVDFAIPDLKADFEGFACTATALGGAFLFHYYGSPDVAGAVGAGLAEGGFFNTILNERLVVTINRTEEMDHKEYREAFVRDLLKTFRITRKRPFKD